MNFVKVEEDKITIELNFTNASCIANALADSIEVQKYNHQADEIAKAATELNMIIAQAAKDLARQLASNADSAEYRISKLHEKIAERRVATS